MAAGRGTGYALGHSYRIKCPSSIWVQNLKVNSFYREEGDSGRGSLVDPESFCRMMLWGRGLPGPPDSIGFFFSSHTSDFHFSGVLQGSAPNFAYNIMCSEPQGTRKDILAQPWLKTWSFRGLPSSGNSTLLSGHQETNLERPQGIPTCYLSHP